MSRTLHVLEEWLLPAWITSVSVSSAAESRVAQTDFAT